ncbi:MAG: orotidine-5'-phosphate decarboxylase, partial [Clostridia bacterium]|nr:orotidine-5'-phosphate decarboxylase [Clostridia bacterium]
MNIIDRLIENTIKTQNPTVVGLDPDINKIPACYKTGLKSKNPFEAVAEAIYNFNRDVIDTVAGLVPAVKPQMAFYEKYGSRGVASFEKTVAYAKSKGLIVIEDAKRNDIGNTAKAYADGHIGAVELLDKVGFNALEAWGGATFDSCLRFLKEDPWERLRKIKDKAKNTPLQMLFRG